MSDYSLAGLRRAQSVRIFLREHVRHTKDRWAGDPFLLEDWQWRNMILPVYGTLRKDGLRRYHRALFGLPRWQGKDELCGALNLYHLAQEPIYGGEQYAVATTLSQANLLFNTVRMMANTDPFLRAVLDVHKGIIECPETGAIFKTLPHDADTAQGFHGSFVVLDEMHVYRDRRMITAMQTGMLGREEPLLIAITTAGEERKGPWWEIRKEWAEDPESYVYWCGAEEDDDATDPEVWRRCNPASWLTDDMLRGAFASNPLPAFERLHLNRAPKRGANRVFDEPRWRACGARPKIDPERPCIIGVDASQRRDHTCVVLDQLDAQGVHQVMCFAFVAEAEGDIMSAIDQDAVGELIRELCASYNVVRIPCDRAYFVRIMAQLLAEGLPIEEFPQTDQNMTRACQRLFDAVAEERVAHGNDPALTEYVLNAAVKIGRLGGFRFTKPDEESKIDGAIALAMAVDVAEAEDAEGHGVGVMVI